MSNDILKLITLEINKNEALYDKGVKIQKFQYLKKSNVLKALLKGTELLTQEEEEEIRKVIQKLIHIDVTVEVVFYQDITNVTLQEICDKYFFDAIKHVIEKTPLAKSVFLSGKKEVKENILYIYNGYEEVTDFLKKKGIEKELSREIKDIFGVTSQVQLIFDEALYIAPDYDAKAQKEKEAYQNAIKDRANAPKEKKESKQGDNGKKPYEKRDFKKEAKNENTIMGRGISTQSIPISEIDETSGVVTIIGDVFKTEVVETKTGKIILTFFITDLTSSISVKCFLKPQDTEAVLEAVKKGLYCKVRGEATFDTYAKEVVVFGRDIEKLKKAEKMDGAQEKRIELHCHTTMSAMDGVTNVKALVERAARWGHEAIAITDHGVVQAFPDAQIAAKKNKIKVLYGVEGYLVNDGIPIALNEKGQDLLDEYVVFDIETTGFSPVNDSIIEIGAVKVKNGEIVDNFSSFVDPQRRLPFKIIELTSITDEMLKGQERIDTVLPKFLDFVGDAVVVAHNAGFDTGFIKKNCRDFGLEFNNTIVDTVPLARFMLPELKRVKLNLVCKALGISLDNHHRAVDDAKATADILLEFTKRLREDKEIFTLKQLNDSFLSEGDVKRMTSYHIIILAKTQEGLKNLYKLVSEAHIDNFFKNPRTKRSRLQEMRDGLIIGSACDAGELIRAILDGRSDDELKEIASFYDYLEIQPIGNTKYMIAKGIAKDEENLRDINRKIYALGKSMNKRVVGTGDVHFLDPQDEAFRRIIMAGKGFSDADDQAPLYYRTTEEMLREFAYLGKDAAYEVVIKNPKEIAAEIEVLKPIPDETYPPKIEGADDDIRNMTMSKVHSIYGENLPEVVQKRLDKELNSIINNGYAVLYLIAQKLVAKSLEDGYLVGSRGSVGSSFVATMTDITEVNGLPPHYVCPNCKKSEFFMDGSVSSGADLPDKNCPDCGTLYIKEGHDIPFETFLGFEGDKEPDIDLNFSGEYQGVVHKYCEVLFGEGYVYKAGTIGTVAEKTAYGYVRKYLDERGKRASNAEIERLTLGCTGIKRTTGQHPGGIMVVPNDNEIYNFCPIQKPADDVTSDVRTTHFDYHSISGRLLKLDILGHDDPTMIRMLQDLTGIDPKSIPLNDPEVISLFTRPDALGVTREQLKCEVGSYGLPEFGTKFVRGMLVDTQPQSFADLVRISGLSHGTDVWLNNAQYFIKEGYTTLKDCISTRDDIMVYLMYKGVPPKLAFTIMESVRKGKGLTEDFEKSMKENDVPDWYIESCRRIKYMFPKGHAVAYVMMAVRIAYFKVHYPLAYYATYFTVRADDFDADLICKGEAAMEATLEELYELGNKASVKDKGMITVLELSFEMSVRGFKFLKVDIYKSEATKFIIEGNALRPPINALQGVGENAAKSIVEARKDGEFISKEDLRNRSKVSKTVIETLDNHGCLEGMSDTNQLSLF
ncbi:MAG: PolC-type DNA polymerase III [Clostridium sp.]